jgi:cytoskeletal protein RodZ
MRVYKNGKWVPVGGNSDVRENFNAGDSADPSSDSKSNMWLWIVLGVIGAILVGIIVWCMIKKSHKSSENFTADASNVDQGFGSGYGDLSAILDGL